MRVPNTGRPPIPVDPEFEATVKFIEDLLDQSPEEYRKTLAALIAEEKAQIENEMERRAAGRPRQIRPD